MKTTLLAALLLPSLAMASEGMWTLDNLPAKQMQTEYGFTADPAWIEKVMHSSLRIAGGCSASFVSPDGLVMTNHHCARSCLSQLSTANRDFIKDGFLAAKREDEQMCPEMELNRLETITDVTDKINAATKGLEGDAFKKAKTAVEAKLTSECVGEDKKTMRCDVVDLYHGGRYHLYKYHRFQDVRVVWAPEAVMAFFGGDPDNFNFPRYDLDITMLRAYEDGKPVKVKDYFPFSKNGAEAGEMVFTSGQPGSTQRQLTMAQLMSLRDLQLINGMIRYSELRGVIEQYQRSGAEAKRVSDSEFFGIENTIKAFRGRLDTLLDPSFVKTKQAEEDALRKFVDSKPELKAKVGGAWDAIEKAEQTYRQIDNDYTILERGTGFGTRYFNYARTLVRGADERLKPNGERLREFADARLPEVEQRLTSRAPVYPDYEQVKLTFSLTKMRETLGADAPLVKQVLGKLSPDQLAEQMIKGSKLNDPAVREALWKGGKDAIAKSDDPFIKLALAVDAQARGIRKIYEDQVESVVQKNTELISTARFAQLGTGVYPDATFTLRLSYGEIKGWDEKGKPVPAFTNIGGAFERATGNDPFALPASWINAKSKLNLDQRFNFASTNDIIGGNSGSPIINRKAEIIGLAFDGNINSLGGAFWYDGRTNRTVGVHSGAILEVLDKIYGAKELAKEIRGN